MWKSIKGLVSLIYRYHVVGAFLTLLISVAVITVQVSNRRTFADGELHRDVMERWGTPITQPVPSVRYVPSGAVFNTLQPLPLERQAVSVEATMNYRKRGLVYFSGFDFRFSGRYEVRNSEPFDIDIAFVVPIDVEKNRVLLSDLLFLVDGQEAPIELDDGADKLVWTGRIARGKSLGFDLSFRGRGLDSFLYKLDPDLPVRNFALAINVTGGDTFDYGSDMVPATSTTTDGDTVHLEWSYASLEAGVPVGVVLPAEKSFDEMIATMARRAWAPFLLFYGGVIGLCLLCARRLRFYEGYMVASIFGFYFVLLAYLAAFMHFYGAFIIATAAICALLWLFLGRTLSPRHGWYGLGLAGAFLVLPNLAVVLQGYTGLIYTLEILAGLVVLVVVGTRKAFHDLIEQVLRPTTAVLLFALLSAGTSLADQPPAATATLPLEEVLRLYHESQRAKEEPAPVPRIVTLDKLELEGRIRERALELTARCQISVGDGDGWGQVPLLALDDRASVSALPEITGGLLTVDRDILWFHSDTSGVHRLEIGLIQRAVLADHVHAAKLVAGPATLAVMHLKHDAALFQLVGDDARRSGDSTVIYPEKGPFIVRWRQLAAVATEPPTREVPTEPGVERAFASVVSTLEGQRITRVLYELKLRGKHSISVEIPAGERLLKVYRNRVSVPFVLEGDRVTLEISPLRAGDESGHLELVLQSDRGRYNLSGNLEFALPLPSWDVKEYFLETHLPQVFNYRRSAGSLSPVEESPAPDFTHQIPAPGKQQRFHQYLVSRSLPRVVLGYTVDLAGKYFR